MTENRRLCWHWGTGEEPTHAELFQGDPAEANDSVLYHGANWSMTDEHKALIAAAPDLLAAAQQVIDTWESGDLAAAVRGLDAAVAKARRQA